MKWPLVIACFFLPHSCIGCQFQERWNGRWFQSGVTGPVTINATEISSKGSCVEIEGDKFLIHDQKYNCYRCMVFHEKHQNVLQYKETFCTTEGSKPILTSTCSELAGDATLYSLFRMGVAPTACPIKGPLEFIYSLGEDVWCESPKSQAEACTQESRLLLRYQACPNVHSTESVDVELECLATWKEGSTQYLVGRLHSSWKTNDETSYRCFIYHKASNRTWNLAESADAACSGFASDKEGARSLRLWEKTWSVPCKYPMWLFHTKSWVALDQIPSRLLTSAQNLTILDINETRLVCHYYVDNHNYQVKLVAKAMRECKNGYVCLVFHKRDDHVIEMQQSNWTQEADEACRSATFNTHTTPYTTFTTTEPMTKQCPYLGRYEVVSILHPHSAEYSTGMRCHQERVRLLDIGCRTPDRMEVATSCTDDSLPEYLCHGTWMENDTAYLVATTDAGRYCLVYSASAATPGSRELSVTGHLASCPRTSHRHPASWQVNLTSHAQCGDASSATTWRLTSGDSPAFRLALLWSLVCSYVTR